MDSACTNVDTYFTCKQQTMDEKEMAKMMMEIIMKANDLKKTMSALFIVQEEIKRQINTNIEKANKDLEFHSMQQKEFKGFLTEIAK